MKSISVVLAVCIIFVVAPPAFGQRVQRRPAAVRRGRHYRYEDRRSDIKERQTADEAAAEAARLQKSEQTKAISQQTLQSTTTGPQQSGALQMHQRLTLINGQLNKLESEKKAALEAGKPTEEFEAQMESLKQEAAGLRASLGLPAE